MNKIGLIKSMALSILGVSVLAGCGAFNKSGVSGSEGRIVTLADGRKVVVNGQKQADGSVSGGETPASGKNEKALTPPKSAAKDKGSKPAGKNNRKNNDKKPQDVSVSDRESVEGDAVSESSVTVDNVSAKEIADSNFTLNGEWTIYSVRGNLVSGEERPYVTFDLPAKRFYGNNGCNYINGDLAQTGDRGVKFENMISTLKMCQNDQYQYLINLALNDVVSFVVRQDKRITLLDMKDSAGRVILVLRRHNMDFLNGAWKIEDLNGSPLVQDDEATMTFDTSDLKIHGTTGCNIFNGELFIDPDKVDSLQILKLVTTRMACPPDSRETEFLLALESVETARRISPTETMLYSAEGNPLFKLVKMELKSDNGADE